MRVTWSRGLHSKHGVFVSSSSVYEKQGQVSIESDAIVDPINADRALC